jgi:hypothetical protein
MTFLKSAYSKTHLNRADMNRRKIIMISRQKLIEALTEWRNSINRDYLAEVYARATLEDVIEYIESQPPADQWIPVAERLPDESGAYLVSIGNYNGVPKVWRMYFTTVEYPRWLTFYKVTAWMPLPEPYKEGEKE